jgi:hypothetical protein
VFPDAAGAVTWRTVWGVRWISPYGSHVTEEPDRAAAFRLQREKRLQAGCASEVVRRDVETMEWRRPGRPPELVVGGEDEL